VERFDVTTIGEGQLRLCVPAGKRLEQASQFDVFVSGTEANVTCTLGRLGWACGWISALPETPLGYRVRHDYLLAGLNLEAVKWLPEGRLATYYVEYAVPPRAAQVYFDRKHSSFSQLTTADVDWTYLLDTRLLHLTGITLALSSNLQEVLREAAARAKDAGIPISFDVNYRRRLWTSEEAKRFITPLAQTFEVLFCGRSDAVTVFGCDHPDPEKQLRALAEQTTATYVVMSMAEEGLMGWTRTTDTCVHVPAREVVILDRIGAGDAMVAGVLHGYLQGDFGRGLKYGALTAALALSQYGDQPVTNVSELEHLLTHKDGMIVR
jgi:2-dehydro-3-deoxygluconokinase